MLSVVELVDDTLVAEMEVGELAVGVDEIREVHRPLALVVALPISAMWNSKPCGRSMRTRCSAPVTGFPIGSPTVSMMPGTAKRPRRASTSTANRSSVTR